MVWGTHSASPRQHFDRYMTREPPADDDGRIPQTAECRCGATAILAAGRLPRDWRIVDGEAKCGDCLMGSTIDFDPAAIRDILRRKESQSIGGIAESRPHHGCRIADEVVCGFVALELRAGAATPDGRDEAISFLLDAQGIDQLIIELSGIRAELVASKHFGTGAHERSGPCAN